MSNDGGRSDEVICSSPHTCLCDMSGDAHRLADGSTMTSARPRSSGPCRSPLQEFTLPNGVRVELILTLAPGLFWPLKAAMFSLSTPKVPLHIWSVLFLLLFSLVSFSTDPPLNQTRKCSSCRSVSLYIWAAKPFFSSSSRFLALRADNGALCLTAEIVYCFPFEQVFTVTHFFS